MFIQTAPVRTCLPLMKLRRPSLPVDGLTALPTPPTGRFVALRRVCSRAGPTGGRPIACASLKSIKISKGLKPRFDSGLLLGLLVIAELRLPGTVDQGADIFDPPDSGAGCRCAMELGIFVS